MLSSEIASKTAICGGVGNWDYTTLRKEAKEQGPI